MPPEGAVFLDPAAVNDIAGRADALGGEVGGLAGHVQGACDSVRAAHGSWLSSLKVSMYAGVCERNVQSIAAELGNIGGKLRADVAELQGADQVATDGFGGLEPG